MNLRRLNLFIPLQQSRFSSIGPFILTPGMVAARLQRLSIRLLTSGGLLVFVLFAQAESPRFSDPVHYDAAGSPRAVAIGDLNHDGRPDIVTANYANNTVSVFIGMGFGVFTNAILYSTGLSPTSVAVGDVNGDGHPDIATSNYNDDTVSLLFGRGDGTFLSATNVLVSDRPDSIAIADFNGDGTNDLALSHTVISVTTVLNGGTFETAATNTVPGGSLGSLVTGDFNGDGRPDLAVSTGDGSVAVLLNQSNGRFSSPSNYPATFYFAPARNLGQIVPGDFDGDGHPDLVTANLVDGSTFLKGRTDGSFVAVSTNAAGTSPVSIAVGDFDGDGNLDFVTVNYGPTILFLRPGNGDGTFGLAITLTNDVIPSSLLAGDVSGDGKSDLILTGGGRLDVYLNVTAPKLKATRAGDGIGLSWPLWSGYRLEWNSDLADAAGWAAVPGSATVVNGRLTLNQPPAAEMRFYRLTKP